MKEYKSKITGLSYNKSNLREVAVEVAANSPCAKRKVGAVLAEESIFEQDSWDIAAVGFNYDTEGSGICETSEGKTKDTVIHAEMACLENAGKLVYPERYAMFITHEPCDGCKAGLKAAGINYEVTNSFMKFDDKKPRMQLVPPSLGIACAEALTYGAKKYKVNNWRNATDIECYISALTRHLDAWRSGEDNDEESGLSHLCHMAANLAFIIELEGLPKYRIEGDKK